MQQDTLRSMNFAFAMPLLSLCLLLNAGSANASSGSPASLGAFDVLKFATSSPSSAFAGASVADECEEEDLASQTPTKNFDQDGIMLAAAQKTSKTHSAAAAKTEADKPATPPPPPPAPVWEITPSDGTLNGALARWSAQAGWQLSWELPVDYTVEARTAIPGTFEEAVEAVAKSMSTAEIPLKAIFYKGNKVLRIVAKGIEQ
ncbi:toxin co-regulated pilus biosynthesis Q family protein [Noviherbaspirillum sp.]|jgi:hypothetical protein|uniref:toxin co-regulated pilus biosynthesis Q family protein n=1 Tax=Noviherbaspirillum sp. TaxID=1926288 RepID=UPI0025F7445E|nr:toxin co-regulated pilus biosynthesis Q family protein [Noviherbaspirillum sp.]